jgi:predicted MFS family arabinose efflux permease
MMAIASAWIEHQRSLAVSLVSAGMGVAPLTVAPFASWLITTYDWRTAMLVIGMFASALLIPAAFLVRSAPAAAPPLSGGAEVPLVFEEDCLVTVRGGDPLVAAKNRAAIVGLRDVLMLQAEQMCGVILRK